MAQPQWRALQSEAVWRRRAGQAVRAIECLNQAIEITAPLPDLAGEHRTMLNYLADLYLQEGQLDNAEATIRRALQLSLPLSGPERGLAADDCMILAKILSKQERHQEAFEAGSQGLALFQQANECDGKFIGQVKAMVDQLKRNLARAPAAVKF